MNDHKDLSKYIIQYLNNELNEEEISDFEELIANDPLVNEEYLVYKGIYEGIEQVEDFKLRKRLDNYRNEYEAKKSVGVLSLKKIFYVSVPIAASFIIFIFVYNFYNQPNSEVPLNAISNDETIKKEEPLDTFPELKKAKTKEVVIKEKETKKIKKIGPEYTNTDDYQVTALGFNDYESLSEKNIKSLVYPQELEYLFNGNTLKIYGDPLIPGILIDVLKDNNTYYLRYDEKIYPLTQKSKKSKLIVEDISFETTETLTKEEIIIEFQSLIKTASVDNSLNVQYKKVMQDEVSYFFRKKDNIIFLLISGPLNKEDVSVYSVIQKQSKEKDEIFLTYGDQLFRIKKKVDNLTSLSPISTMISGTPKLFSNRSPVSKEVKLIQ